MQIFVAGGSGRVATELIKDLVANSDTVVAGARHEDHIIKLDNVKAVHMDLHSSVDDLAKLMKGRDTVYFTASSRGKDLLQTDTYSTVKTMQAAKKLGIERYIMLSSIFTLEPDKWHIDGLDQILDYTIAKYFADNFLVNQSDLKYTILQPTNLTEEKGTGKISLDVTGVTSNPIPDVAKTLAEILKHDNTIGKVIMMKSGDIPIDEALASVK